MKRIMRLVPLVIALTMLVTPAGSAGAAVAPLQQGGGGAAAGAAGPFVSDDFTASLDPQLWRLVDPLGDTRLISAPQGNGDVWLSLELPAGVAHEAWRDGNLAPRILQTVGDTDLDLEVRFTSRLTERYQQVGLAFEEGPDDSLLFGFYTDGQRLYASILGYRGGSPAQLIDVDLGAAGAVPLMRVGRAGDEWSLSYSWDGAAWSVAGTVTYPLALSAAGAFAANYGPEPPAFVASVDYVENVAAPLATHDAEAGGPAVAVTPSQTAPVISALRNIIGVTKVKVTWTTDVPATGAVNYGVTTAYELGTVTQAGDPSTAHEVMITGLTELTTYRLQVVSTVGTGPDAQTATREFSITTDSSVPGPNPIISAWYGPNQTFGALGMGQRWVNIVGNAQDTEGIAEMSFTLNGGAARPLSVGPDNRRLAMPGDFNVEILWSDLNEGNNTVVITAVDELENVSSATVTVNNAVPMPIPVPRTPTWPLPYQIDWSGVTNIQDVAQVVDGQWEIVGGALRPVAPNQLSYDRLVVIGDMDWQDYEVTVPITIHRFYGQDPGVGILTRWRGHGADGSQPSMSYPYGGLGWYRYGSFTGRPSLRIEGNGNMIAEDTSGRQLETGVTYVFKMRAWTQATGPQANVRQWYMLKVWEQGSPEPPQWDLSGFADVAEDALGAPALLAHRIDASFGNVTITPLPDDEGMVLSNIQVDATDTTATISWRSSLPGTSRVEYGLTDAYELDARTSGIFITTHTINIGGLSPNTLYHFRVTVTEADDTETSSSDLTFVTDGPPAASTIRSDDFNVCLLDTSLWTWLDPYGDSSFGVLDTLTDDARLLISVPGGVSHNIWTAGLNAPRLMQPANDTDFEVEVKFESALSERYQEQGILVMHEEADPEAPDDYIHFDFYSDGADTYLWAVVFPNGRPLSVIQKAIAPNGTAPLYMRVTREGDTWTVAHSTDGAAWTVEDPFDFALPVTSVGITASNQGSSGQPAPAHEVIVDYFFNTSSPIVPEDGARANSIEVNVVGQGTVARDPDLESYGCGQRVVLTATPAAGWTFAGWSGSMSSHSNPLSLNVSRSLNLTATFTESDFALTTEVVGEGTVTVSPDKATYEEGDVVTLTAVPEAGWTFAGWSGDATGSDNPTTITISGRHRVTATFEAEETFALTVNVVGEGTVTSDPNLTSYPPGSTVTLTANPGAGWTFGGWSGDLTGSENPATLTMDAAKSVTATFVEAVEGFTLHAETQGSGTVTVSPQKVTYDDGEVVTLTATPAAGWEFTGWSGDLTGNENPATLTITKHSSVTAVFEQPTGTRVVLPLVMDQAP